MSTVKFGKNRFIVKENKNKVYEYNAVKEYWLTKGTLRIYIWQVGTIAVPEHYIQELEDALLCHQESCFVETVI